MGKTNQLWQDRKQAALDDYAADLNRTTAWNILRTLGLQPDEIDDELSAVREEREAFLHEVLASSSSAEKSNA